MCVCLPNKGPCQDAAAPFCLALASLLKIDEEEGSCHCNTLMMELLAHRAAPCWGGGGKVLGQSVLDAGYSSSSLLSEKARTFSRHCNNSLMRFLIRKE